MVAHHPHLPRKPDGMLDVDHQAPDPGALSWIRDRFASWRIGAGPKRLFISRGAAQFRRIKNEAEIEAVLVKRGFTSVRLEELTLAEQVGLFSGLEAVVGAHGAGFTNLAFAPPGTKVVELHPPGTLPLYFAAMCQSLDHSHAAIAGTAVRALNPLKRAFWHFTIDPLTLEAQLDAMGL
jgi:capsular polysaccharide biosynthesis protein